METGGLPSGVSLAGVKPAAWCVPFVAVALLLAACGGSGGDSGPAPERVAALGARIFEDVSLSASGRQSCATCHDAAHAHGPPNALATQPGGATMDQQGARAAPAIDYAGFAGAFRFDANGRPVGGLFWDGRAATLQEQAASPLLSPLEMANNTRAEVVARLARAAYADEFKALFGADIFSRGEEAFERATLALQQFQQGAAFRPFSSRYDAALRGAAALTAAEQRGLALFTSPAKGNCAACHPATPRPDGGPPLFSNFGYENLGVPRNPGLVRNEDGLYFDIGLCGRGDLQPRTDLCGFFKVPTLRNVARRGSFFHNGRFGSLREVLSFYATRDTEPERWYPRDEAGNVLKFDDLPPHLRGSVNTHTPPYAGRVAGGAPALSEAEIDDLLAFLLTLNDGYTVSPP